MKRLLFKSAKVLLPVFLAARTMSWLERPVAAAPNIVPCEGRGRLLIVVSCNRPWGADGRMSPSMRLRLEVAAMLAKESSAVAYVYIPGRFTAPRQEDIVETGHLMLAPQVGSDHIYAHALTNAYSGPSERMNSIFDEARIASRAVLGRNFNDIVYIGSAFQGGLVDLAFRSHGVAPKFAYTYHNDHVIATFGLTLWAFLRGPKRQPTWHSFYDYPPR